MRPVDIDTESYRRAQLNIGRSSADTDAALTAFVNELRGHGEPWGNDELGALIGLSYQGIFAAAMDCFASNLDVIDDYAERLGHAAAAYDRADSESAQRTQRAGTLPDLPL